MRIVSENTISSAATLTATSEVLPASNLATDRKSEIWRSNTTTQTLTVTFTEAKFISLVALPFCNFTSTATMNIRVYSDEAGLSLIAGGGTNTIATPCCEYSTLDNFDWGAAPLGVNAYSYGGGVYAVVWIPINAVKRIEIDIIDVNNSQGYLEAGMMVLGIDWEPVVDAAWGAGSEIVDSTTTQRTDSGDSISDRGTVHKKITLNLEWLSTADRSKMMLFQKYNGKPKPVFISVYPENDDVELEQDNQIYGKFTTLSKVSNNFLNNFTSSMTIEEI